MWAVRLATVCVALLLAAPVLSEPPAESPCPAWGSYRTLHQSNVAHLRWSLYSISSLRLVDEKPDPRLVSGLADGAVFCLANIYSLRAQSRLKCASAATEEYQRDLAENQRFVTLLFAATSSPDFPTARLIGRDSLLATAPLALGRRPLELDDKVLERVRVWKKQGSSSRTHPLAVAGAELLGEDFVWDEADLAPLEQLFPVNRETGLARVPLAEGIAALGKGGWRDSLQRLAGYYRVGR